MDEELTVLEAARKLEDLRQQVSVYLSNKITRFQDDTGIVVTGLSMDVIELTGGFPKSTVAGVVTNVTVRTNLGDLLDH